MSDPVYASGKVASAARALIALLCNDDATKQDKILWALEGIPLCETYLEDMGRPIKRPAWIASNKFDLGALARGAATYEQRDLVYSMAPQRKTQLLGELVDWWLYAYSAAISTQTTHFSRAVA